jgi:hypothetical protein
MIINSPVGRFPFDAKQIRVTRGAVRLDGAMGTWPTTVEVPIGELPAILGRLIPARAAAATAGVLALSVVAVRRRSSVRRRVSGSVIR